VIIHLWTTGLTSNLKLQFEVKILNTVWPTMTSLVLLNKYFLLNCSILLFQLASCWVPNILPAISSSNCSCSSGCNTWQSHMAAYISFTEKEKFFISVHYFENWIVMAYCTCIFHIWQRSTDNEVVIHVDASALWIIEYITIAHDNLHAFNIGFTQGGNFSKSTSENPWSIVNLVTVGWG
jgi:hypothetical protein